MGLDIYFHKVKNASEEKNGHEWAKVCEIIDEEGKVKMTMASWIFYLKVYEPKMTFSKQTLHLGQVISLKSPHDLEIQYDKLGVEK